MRLTQPQYTSNVLKMNDTICPTIWQIAKTNNAKKKVVTYKFSKKVSRLPLL